MISEETKKKYWNLMKLTRKSGRIAQSVIDRVEQGWEKFDDEVVEEALQIHISRYPSYKETYTIGIMRNIQKRRAEGRPVAKKPKNAFHNFHQRTYDYDELEKMLLNAPPPHQ